jgi:UDP-2,3-diacylglucosamine pyrophosphatase LpxH
MSVALIADAHLGGAGGSAEELVRQLDAIESSGCERLVLLGDIFHVWVGARRFETRAIRTVYSRLLQLARQGLQIDYIEGNRDFFLADSEYAEAFSSIGTEMSFVAGSRRYLAVHGDGLNDRDRQYLFWRWLSKSSLSRALILHLPASIARWALNSTEVRLARTNFKHRKGVPQQAISRFAERRLAEGFDTLLLGHFHEPRSWEVAGGEVRILDAWFNSQRVEWIGDPDPIPAVSDP